MSKHKKPSPSAANSTPEMLRKIEVARKEGRTQQALDLAKTLHKHEPTPAHLALLMAVYLERGDHLRRQNQAREAADLYGMAARFGEDDPEWIAKLAEAAAKCGPSPQLTALSAKLASMSAADPALVAGVEARRLASLADAWMTGEKIQREMLPPAMADEYKKVVAAFAHLHAGRDAEAAEAVKSVPMKSPFAEYRLLLRGFAAFYAGDDGRAAENWQRLDPARLAAKMAAPFRASVDAAFRDALPAKTRDALEKQLRLAEPKTDNPLARIRKRMSNRETEREAFGELCDLAPEIRKARPDLFARLHRAAYWMLLHMGPSMLKPFTRGFGNPPLDPKLHHLSALGYDNMGSVEEAHRLWKLYLADLDGVAALSDDERRVARALVYERMGEAAAEAAEAEDDEGDDFYFAPRARRRAKPPELDPGPAACYERAIALAPDHLSAHEKLIDHFAGRGNLDEVRKAADRLLRHFPDHLPTLTRYVESLLQAGEFARAAEMVERALAHHPLDRGLRARAALAHRLRAEVFVESAGGDQADEGIALFEKALTFSDAADRLVMLSGLASALARFNRAEAAEARFAEAKALVPAEVAAVYAALVYANVFRLPTKPALAKSFNALIAETPDPAAAAVLARFAASQRYRPYNGRQTHTKKIAEYALGVGPATATEEQLVGVAAAVVLLDPPIRKALDFLRAAGKRFRRNFVFPWAYARLNVLRDTASPFQDRYVAHALQLAKLLAQKVQPPTEQALGVLSDVEVLLGALQAEDPHFDLDDLGDFEDAADADGHIDHLCNILYGRAR